MMLNLQENLEFLIMEKLGSSLFTVMSKCGGFPFSKTEVLGMGIELLSDVTKLHSIGYIHGDIKPDNVLLCTGD